MKTAEKLEIRASTIFKMQKQLMCLMLPFRPEKNKQKKVIQTLAVTNLQVVVEWEAKILQDT